MPRQLLISAIFLLFLSNASGNELVLIESEQVNVTADDVESYLLTVPEDDRKLLRADKKRLLAIISNLLINKKLLLAASEKQFDQDPEVQAKTSHYKNSIIIEKWLDAYRQTQPPADYEAIAHEQYLLNQDQYITKHTVDVEHVLIVAKERGPQEAEDIARGLLNQIRAGEITFEQALEHSEDPSYVNNKGLFKGISQGMTVPQFEQAAFALTADQPLSDVVNTQFGSHIIRFVANNEPRKMTFDEVKKGLVNTAKKEHEDRTIATYLQELKQQEADVDQQALNSYLGGNAPG